jgi:hypothetical protein
MRKSEDSNLTVGLWPSLGWLLTTFKLLLTWTLKLLGPENDEGYLKRIL